MRGALYERGYSRQASVYFVRVGQMMGMLVYREEILSLEEEQIKFVVTLMFERIKTLGNKIYEQ